MALVIPNLFANEGLNTPTALIDEDFAEIAEYINNRNPTYGAIGSRPAAGNAGAIWVASDQGNLAYLDDGAAWQRIILPSVLPGADFFLFDGIATPSTPASGKGALYAPSAPSGLRRPRWIDAGGQLQDMGGIIHREVGNPIKTIVNTTTETSLWTSAPTIKGGTLGNHRRLRVRWINDVLQNSGATKDLTYRLKYGGTTVWSVVVTYGTSSATRHTYPMQFLDIFALATNVQVTAGGFQAYSDGNGPTNTAVAVITEGTADSTADQTLDLTIQWSAAHASTDFRPLSLSVEVK